MATKKRKKKSSTPKRRKPPSRKTGKGAKSRPKKPAYRKPVPKKRKPAKPIKRKKPKAKSKPRPKKRPSKLQKLQRLARERAEYLREVFDRARENIDAKFLPSFTVVQNSDATVDGELRIRQIPRGLSARYAMLEIEENLFGLSNLGYEWWMGISILVAQRAKEAERSPMPRYKGLARAGAYPQRATMFKGAVQWTTARGVVRNVERAGYRKPEQIVIRFHWNNYGEKPNR